MVNLRENSIPIIILGLIMTVISYDIIKMLISGFTIQEQVIILVIGALTILLFAAEPDSLG